MGLGNPGAEYSGTRHNVGFMVVECLARRWGIPAGWKAVCSSRVGTGRFRGSPVRLAQPQRYMNLSGGAVGCLVRRFRQDPSALLVVLDDVSLPLGQLRLRGKGSAGGHLGLASVLEQLGTEAVPRLRVGIGSSAPGEKNLSGFVLSRFGSAEKKDLEKVLSEAADACETWVAGGLEAAMNRFNRKGR